METPWLSLEIGDTPLSLPSTYQWVAAPTNGAIALFVGTVRDAIQQPVAYLDYEAYEPLARQSLTAIAEACRRVYPSLQRAALHHRVGRLAIGEISVIVAMGPTAPMPLGPAKPRSPASKPKPQSGKKKSWATATALGATCLPIFRYNNANPLRKNTYDPDHGQGGTAANPTVIDAGSRCGRRDHRDAIVGLGSRSL
ncbi:MAG: molybdenum cofactor biosynthesis protein MoaE [Oscillatoriales cyanobacterium SM2_1_8]|nr:molybdenum cofactor biosynthesis protein MoaE [Oscillatoriales cyanobacterium SM2_1_8]